MPWPVNRGTLGARAIRVRHTIQWRARPMLTQKQFYKSTAWKRARKDYIQQRMAVDGGLCEVCGEEPGLIVHHKIWLDDMNCNDPEISLNPKNFLYECQTCHNKEKDPRRATPGRCLYGPDGEVIRNSQY